jgi:hypothetical protein
MLGGVSIYWAVEFLSEFFGAKGRYLILSNRTFYFY